MDRKQISLGKLLHTKEVITTEQLEEALSLQSSTGDKLGRIFIDLGYVTSRDIACALADQNNLEFIDLARVHISADAIKLVPYDLCRKYSLIPVSFDEQVFVVALADPLNLIALDDLRVFLSKDIKGVIAAEDEIKRAIEKYYKGKEDPVTRIAPQAMAEEHEEIDVSLADALKAEGEEIGEDEAPVIQLVSRIILEAFKRRASDVHVEPMKDRVRIRYRIDGSLAEVPGPPKTLQGAVLSRLKIMARLDIAEKRLPQDGRIKVTLGGRDVDIRVSSLPALYGESIVLRLLDRERLLLDLKELGFSSEDEKTFRSLINIPNGIMLVTGPTGSGKTTTLYTSLHTINKPNRKIITVEDPVEYQLRGINQVHVKPAIGLTFAAGLRAILRQAPNVIMIGEVRDLETANIAIEASLTGHLVFSTLHTNDAAGAVTRLIDMGVKSYLVASAVRAILAQRLVKKICVSCKEQTKPHKEVLDFLAIKPEQVRGTAFYKGKGCEECSFTGYSGRMAIFELLVLNDEICDLIYKKVSSNIIRERARQCGMRTLREDGLLKAFKGLTTLEEVVRVTQSDIE